MKNTWKQWLLVVGMFSSMLPFTVQGRTDCVVYREGMVACQVNTATIDRVALNDDKTILTLYDLYGSVIYSEALSVVDSVVFATMEQEAYYVTPSGDGLKNGTNWENALDAMGLASLLAGSYDLSDKSIYLQEGKYIMPLTKLGTNVLLISGGYASASTGTNLDVPGGETILSGGGVNALFFIDGRSVKFEHITIADGFVSADGSGSAITVKGDWNTTVVELTDCVVRDNRSSAPGREGAALSLMGGFVKLRNVQILDNTATNRGAGVSMNESSVGDQNNVKLFMNNCVFRGNRLTSNNGSWGADLNIRRGHVFVNNTTFFGNIGVVKGFNKGCINSDGMLVGVNSTFIGNAHTNFLVRNNNSSANQGFVNCLFVDNGSDVGVSGGDHAQSRSLFKGWNVYQTIDMQPSVTDTDASQCSFTGLDTEENYYVWNVESINRTTYATQTNVLEVLKDMDGNHGIEFVQWVGEPGFATDQRGEARNASKLQPGAFDAGL